ncbi:hypothetical protein KI387_011514, partial [Taxus chinensis]
YEGKSYTVKADPPPFKTCNMLYRPNDVLIPIKTPIHSTQPSSSNVPQPSTSTAPTPSTDETTVAKTTSLPAANIPTSDPLVDVFQRLTLGEYRLYNVSSFPTPQEYGQLHAHPTYDRRVGE